MTIRCVSRAITPWLLTCGVIAIAPAKGSAQQRTVLPEQGGPITVVGCFLRETIDKKGEKYVLVRPTIGPATSVAEATCTSTGTGQIVELEGLRHLDLSQVGRWIEVTGRLEAGHQAIRELNVRAYRVVPVVAPRVAEAAPAPAPAPAPAVIASPVPAVEATPAATPGVTEQLPQTASSLPLIGLIGLLALAGGVALRLIDRRRTL